jgi:hypothetical protein
MSRPLWITGCLLVVLSPSLLSGQDWNSPHARSLVTRAIARRATDPARGLRDFRALAHGFVFFLAQLGEEGLEQPPQLVKSDQLELEVYWKAPGLSKQRIVGWRDRTDLPTDIQYHRDHLGIVQNGFADRIRLGEGDEVRDVPHPLAPDGPDLYDFAVVDSLQVLMVGRSIQVHEVAFRPRDPDAPRIVGSLYLDAAGGELVQLRFSFTRAAYLDPSVEDIAIVLETGLWEGTYWLPRRQEIEIRRRTTWLDVPARGIIRGRWEIDAYTFDAGLDDQLFQGPEIVVTRSARDSFPWTEPIDEAVVAAVGPQQSLRIGDVRRQVHELMAGRRVTGLRTTGLSIGSFSQLLHVNRVEGLTPGLGFLWRPPVAGGQLTLRGWGSYGVSDERVKGGARITFQAGGARLGLMAERAVRDIGDRPVISRVLNSFLAQELGEDYGDYVGLDLAELSVGVGGVEVRVGRLRPRSLGVAASPSGGTYRPNPALGSGDWWVAALDGRGRVGTPGYATGDGRLLVEGGLQSGAEWLRLSGAFTVAVPAGATEIGLEGYGGWGSPALPPSRSFVLGGRATLEGEPFRGYGGRAAAWGRLDWRVPVPFPAIPLGRFASTGRQLIVAPFAAVGWTTGPMTGVPWVASDGVRPVVGLSVEAFHRLLRVDAGWAPRTGTVGVTVDVRRSLWPIL